ncbi:MAG: hypothetical protein LBO09_06365 [Candidatus Peribacteria bacterium]|nr:hypothetical protein [Candidatus Peribacteria bacterium]
MKNFTPVQYDMLKQLMNEYIETVKPQPTKHIEANYMIDPIITPKSSC